jgi:hypothetical protein
MARHRIHDESGKPTRYFWSDKYKTGGSQVAVFKETDEGVKRMKKIFFDTQKAKMIKEA